jgi:hypothetical protein
MRKFGDAADSEIAVHARRRIAAARRRAADLGIVAANVPGTTAMIKATLNEEVTYRAMSAVAHGYHWALQRFGFEVAGELPDNPGLHRIEKQLSPTMTLAFGSSTFVGFVKAIECRARLQGLDVRQFREIVGAVFIRSGLARDDPA